MVSFSPRRVRSGGGGDDVTDDGFVEESWHIMVISMGLGLVKEPFFLPMGGN